MATEMINHKLLQVLVSYITAGTSENQQHQVS
jgi:hypothetical protein